MNVFWRAARRLGLGADAAAPAQAAGLIDIGAHVRFSHPLLRSAVYRAASLPDRREAHRALAEATDPEVDPDGRAWHRAHAADAPDEDVAAELERSAGSAAARGGVAAAAAFLEWATELTPDPARRGQRALTAAQAKLQAGGFEQATSMLAAAETGPLDALQTARVDLTRARIAFAQGRCSEAASAAAGCRAHARVARCWARPRDLCLTRSGPRCSPGTWRTARACSRWHGPRARLHRRPERTRETCFWMPWPHG